MGRLSWLDTVVAQFLEKLVNIYTSLDSVVFPQVVGSISTCTRWVATRLVTTLSPIHILSHLRIRKVH